MKAGRWLAALPGLLVYALVYSWVSIRGEFAWEIVNSNYQSLGETALSLEPLTSLAVLHIQPPALNALYALALATPVDPSVFLQSTFFLVGFMTVFCVVAALLLVEIPRGVALVSGILMAVIPTTTLYVLWPYSTSLVALLISVAIFGIALLKNRPIWGAAIFVVGIVGLFYTRPSFIWIFAIPAVFFPIVVGPKQMRGRLITVAMAGSCFIVALQGYHLSSFGSWTTSSWTGQNVLKGLIWSGQVTADDIVQSAGDDPCLKSLALSLEFWGTTTDFHESCFVAPSGPMPNALAFQESLKPGGEFEQMNSIRHLEVASAWRALAWNVLKAKPLAIPQMVLGVGPAQTSIELTFAPGHQFSPLDRNLIAGTPIMSLSRPFAAILPAGGLAIMLLLGGVLLAARGTAWSQFPTFLTAALLAAQGLLTSIVPEFGENNRFFVEVYPALVAGSAIALYVAYQGLRTHRTTVSNQNDV